MGTGPAGVCDLRFLGIRKAIPVATILHSKWKLNKRPAFCQGFNERPFFCPQVVGEGVRINGTPFADLPFVFRAFGEAEVIHALTLPLWIYPRINGTPSEAKSAH